MSGLRPAPFAVLCLSLLWLSACGANQAATTQTASATPTTPPPPPITRVPPTATQPAPTDPPTPTAAPTLTPEPPCTNDAAFVEDMTIPDGKQFLPGQVENKKWNVRNSGTCDWSVGYRLVLVSGDSLGAPSEAALYPAKAGTVSPWEITMTAPNTPGVYTGRWQARDPAGNLFGDTVYIEIEVIPLPVTDTPTP